MGMIANFTRRVRQLNLLISPPPQLRRAHERYVVNVPVEIRTALHAPAGPHVALDVSWGGMFLAPRVAASENDTIYVTVGSFLTNAAARIISHRGDGTTIQFASAAEGAALTTWLVRMSEERVECAAAAERPARPSAQESAVPAGTGRPRRKLAASIGPRPARCSVSSRR